MVNNHGVVKLINNTLGVNSKSVGAYMISNTFSALQRSELTGWLNWLTIY